jgi:hypothetical protein
VVDLFQLGPVDGYSVWKADDDQGGFVRFFFVFVFVFWLKEKGLVSCGRVKIGIRNRNLIIRLVVFLKKMNDLDLIFV